MNLHYNDWSVFLLLLGGMFDKAILVCNINVSLFLLADVYAGAQFDWDNLYSVFWTSSASGVKLPTPSPQEPSSYNIYCPEAAHVLLAMTHAMVNQVSAPSQCSVVCSMHFAESDSTESLLMSSELVAGCCR